MADKQIVKVGDRITAKLDDAFKDYRAGDTFYVQKIEEHAGETAVVFTDNVGDTRRRRVSEFTVEHAPVADATGMPAFKVGDRVRVIIKTGVNMPDTGVVGVICNCDDGYTVAVEGVGAFGYDAHDLELVPIFLEHGRYYRSRNGRKIGPVYVVNSQTGGCIADDGVECHPYQRDGTIMYGDSEHLDLIAEWVDEPASNDNAPATAPAIVALIEGGEPKPSEQPKVHKSEQAATDEAERLAVKYPGQKFGVFVLADSRIADVVIRRAA